MTGSSQPPILKARGITKSFGGFRAVNDISLDLAASEILGVIGPNGAGKSTLFNLLAGALPVDAGSIHLASKDLTRARPEARILSGLGRTFQIPRPFPRMTVLENVMTAAQNQLGEGLFSALVAPRQVAAEERRMSSGPATSWISFPSRILRINRQLCFRAGSENCSNLPVC
jgi:branched-chain amino acid transport system ATP-binding protein